MKAVLSNRIYLTPKDPEHLIQMQTALTYKIDQYKEELPKIIIKNIKKIKGDVYSIPIGRVDLIPKGYEVKDKRVLVPVDFPEFAFPLFPSQQEVYDKIEDSALINAPVSWGKTFTALAIAGKLGQKTLIVTHTVGLRTQWEEEIEKVYGFKPGIIGSGIFNTGPDIVVGNIQTLYKYRTEIARVFGTVIVDECHHVPANTFNRLVDSSFARYKIGLSATLNRKDGRHVLLSDYFSLKRFIPPAGNKLTPSVDVIHTNIKLMDGRKDTPWATRVTELVSKEEYGELLCALALSYKSKGHSVLLLSDRVGLLERIKDTLGEDADIITGSTPLESRKVIIDRVLNGEVKVLLGTQSLFAEGTSVNTLSCLILGGLVSNVPLLEQLIGRVVRKVEGKKTPVIVDINLQGYTANKQAQLRRGVYLREGYKIKDVEV